MRLGVSLGYLSRGRGAAHLLALAQEAERRGYAVAWVAEAYGSDAPSLLGWLAGQTGRIELGSAVMQIPARSPAATAMTAATLDAVSGGRFRLGLGVSGPQVAEGWHGSRWRAPLARTREYVAIVRAALARETLRYDGAHYRLPLPDGPGTALRLGFPPLRADLPIYLAALGQANLRLAGEIADGWLAVFLSPEYAATALAAVSAGRDRRRSRAGGDAAGPPAAGPPAAGPRDVRRPDLAGFDVVATVPVVVGDDPAACADRVRPYAALYLGGMGSREQNFYHRQAVAMGYGPAAGVVQDHYLAGRQRDAAAAVPYEFLDQTSLLGPTERIRERLARYREAGVTTLAVLPSGPDPVRDLATVAAVAQ